jgi:hypothetical protein
MRKERNGRVLLGLKEEVLLKTLDDEVKTED